MSFKVVALRDAANVEEVGGKAAALGRLLREKLPVPGGFVIPVAAFEEHIGRAFAKLEKDAAPQVRSKAIMRTPISKRLQEEVQTGWDRYIKSKAAVRSSATVEDSATASFAGQFHTELHVGDVKAALKALRRCWASLFSDHALLYSAAQRRGSPGHMAVIVQEMVEPLYAGVAFTREPMTGAEDVFVSEWVAGVGASLVSGDALDGRVWLSREGTILRADYLRGDDAPEPVVWRNLADKLKLVVKLFGPGQDVEWAWTGKKLFLLQVRPDTQGCSHAANPAAPPPWVLPGRPLGGWKEDEVRLFKFWDEYNPPVVYPLDFHQYMAAIWQASIDMLDFGDGVPQVERIVVLQDEVPVMIDPAGRIKPPSRQFPRGTCAPEFEPAMASVEDRVRSLELEVGNLANLPDDQLLRLLDVTASAYRDIEVTRLLKGMDLWIKGEEQAKKALRRMLRPLGVDVEDTIEALEAGVDHETSRMNRALCELAEFAAREGKTARWSRKLDQFILRFGHFESNGTLLCESRDSILAQIDRMIEAKAQRSAGVDPEVRATALIQELSLRFPEGKKRQAFQQAVSELRRWVAVRENSKMQPALLLPLVKRLQMEAGKRLAKRRLLSKVEDVRLLTPLELRRAFKGKPFPRNVLARRAAIIDWKMRHTTWLPQGFLGESCNADDPILFGISGSPGVAEGPARIVRGPDQFGQVRNGDVVIARATNPVWTQLFNRINAIVVENGSRLSHAAIVAREVGIPAVVGIPGVLAAIKDGEQLRVDGTAGEVIRLEHWKGLRPCANWPSMRPRSNWR